MKFINATKIDRKFGKPRDLRCALPSSNSLQFRPSISTLALVDVDGRKRCHSTNPISLVYVAKVTVSNSSSYRWHLEEATTRAHGGNEQTKRWCYFIRHNYCSIALAEPLNHHSGGSLPG
jgi:hypothetical protein